MECPQQKQKKANYERIDRNETKKAKWKKMKEKSSQNNMRGGKELPGDMNKKKVQTIKRLCVCPHQKKKDEEDAMKERLLLIRC